MEDQAAVHKLQAKQRPDMSQGICTFKTYHRFHVPVVQKAYKHYIIFFATNLPAPCPAETILHCDIFELIPTEFSSITYSTKTKQNEQKSKPN